MFITVQSLKINTSEVILATVCNCGKGTMIWIGKILNKPKFPNISHLDCNKYFRCSLYVYDDCTESNNKKKMTKHY